MNGGWTMCSTRPSSHRQQDSLPLVQRAAGLPTGLGTKACLIGAAVVFTVGALTMGFARNVGELLFSPVSLASPSACLIPFRCT